MFELSLLLFSLAVLVLWVFRLRHTLRYLKGDHVPDSFSRAALEFPVPKITVLIPARNEEDNIETCVKSLLKQDYPDYEIIVVDDRSTDKTASLVEALAKKNSKVSLVSIKELPDGWVGKTNALHQGMKQANGTWFLFTDADTIHKKDSLSLALGHTLRRKAKMFSLTPGLENKTFWEKVLQPLAGGALMIRFPLEKVNDPQSSLAFGNGQFILIEKKTYEKVGGHECVKDVMLEDVALARRVKSLGYSLHVGYGADLFKTRMYSSLKAIICGWSRIYYSAFGNSLIFLAGLLCLIWLVSLSPYIFGVLSIYWMVTQFSFFSIFLFGIVVLQFLVILPTMIQTYKLSHSDPGYVLFHPLASFFLFVILTHAFLKILFKQKVKWRGGQYRENRTV